MISHQGVALFDKIRQIKRHGLVEEVCHWREQKKNSKAQFILISLPLLVDQGIALNYFSSAMVTSVLPAMMLTDRPAETVSKPPVKCSP